MFCIKIAGVVIGVNHRYELVRTLCREYECTDHPAVCVSVTDEEIGQEMAAYERDVAPDYAESVCIYRAICLRLPSFGAFLLHAAALECDGEAYAFAAPSGTGKSTHAAMWVKAFGDRVRIINGDKPIIRFMNDGVSICGAPWCGKEGLNSNVESPLRGLCFIERGETNSICALNSSAAVSYILPQLLMPGDEGGIDRLFALADKLLQKVPTYLLRCNISEDAARLAYEFMKNGEI